MVGLLKVDNNFCCITLRIGAAIVFSIYLLSNVISLFHALIAITDKPSKRNMIEDVPQFIMAATLIFTSLVGLFGVSERKTSYLKLCTAVFLFNMAYLCFKAVLYLYAGFCMQNVTNDRDGPSFFVSSDRERYLVKSMCYFIDFLVSWYATSVINSYYWNLRGAPQSYNIQFIAHELDQSYPEQFAGMPSRQGGGKLVSIHTNGTPPPYSAETPTSV